MNKNITVEAKGKPKLVSLREEYALSRDAAADISVRLKGHTLSAITLGRKMPLLG